MIGNKRFNSAVEHLAPFATDISNDAVKSEPMFFNADLIYAYNHGGPITRDFIDNLPVDVQNSPCVFDSRVHMLMPGWYPAIPGYHHDDVPRPPIPVGQHFVTAGQPDYDCPRYHSRHIMGLVNGDICPTEFALGGITMNHVKDGDLIYRQWHEEIKGHLAAGKMQHYKAPDRTLIGFDWQTFHQASTAVSNGWRWFGRVSWNTERVLSVTNEMRTQVQVYLEFPMEGW